MLAPTTSQNLLVTDVQKRRRRFVSRDGYAVDRMFPFLLDDGAALKPRRLFFYGETMTEPTLEEFEKRVETAIHDINADHDAAVAAEPEIAEGDGYFQIELTLSINRGERLTYNNVVTYTILGSPLPMLMMLIGDEDSVSGTRVVLVNMEKIESVDAPYAPDTLEELLKYTETP